MKTKFYYVLLPLSILFSTGAEALISDGPDKQTKPELYYLKNEQAPDSLRLLPPPPQPGSLAFLHDQAMYEQGRLLRSTPRGKLAQEDARLSGGGVARAFSEAFGVPVTPDGLPEVYRLTTNMIEDAGDLATRSAKKHYMRIRPFAFYKSPTCLPEDEGKLSTNGAYPSGHTSIGWATGLVLSEINPARQDQIMQRAFELGQSRVICGYHWQSDVDAARLVASVVVATLHSEPDFVAQLEKARKEFSAFQNKQNGIKK